MLLTIKIVWRNILSHSGKSLVVGVIIFLGALIMTLGNSIVSGMNTGLKRTVVKGFTGDVVLISDKQETDNVFIDFSDKALEPITNFTRIKNMLADQTFIAKFLPAGLNMAMLLNEEGGSPGNTLLLGVDFTKYADIFPDNLQIIEGRMFTSKEPGVLIPAIAREELYEFENIWFMPQNTPQDAAHLPAEVYRDKSNLAIRTNGVLMGFNNDNTTYDIRLTVKGIIRYRAFNSLWGHIVFTDIASFRRCMGYITPTDKPVSLPPADKAILDMSNGAIDELFGNDAVITDVTREKVPAASAATQDAFNSFQSDAATKDTDKGVYNLVFILLKEGISQRAAVLRLNTILKEQNLGVRAVGWQAATDNIGSIAGLLKAALFVFVMFLFFVAVIVIVNTLSMAAVERTAEISTMRAIGAKKKFVGAVFIGETAILVMAFGVAGIMAGGTIAYALSLFHFTSNNDIVQLLFGGDTFHPILTTGDILITTVQLIIVLAISATAPVRIARKISPLTATLQT